MEKEMILDLIDRRYSDRQKTLLTSNFNRQEMKEFLGPRTESRLFDQHNTVLEFWNADRRGIEDFKEQY